MERFNSQMMLLALLSVSDACSASDPCKMPNIDYLGMGYDIIRGNPHCSSGCLDYGIDPGWAQTNPVLAFIYDNTTTGDGRFYVPKGFRILQTPACTMTSNTLSVHSTRAYQSALSIDAQVSGGEASWSFSASADYQTTSKSLSDYSKTQYQTTATCGVYTANVLADYTLNLTDSFRRGVSDLPLLYDKTKYGVFVSNYGSHFLNHVMMGAKYTYQMEFSTSDVSTMTSKGVDVSAAVSVNMLLAHAAASTNVSWHWSDNQEMKKFQYTQSQNVVGNLPPQPFNCSAVPCSPDQMDMSSWQALLLTDSADLAPLNYHLQGLETLLTSEYFPLDANISAKAANLVTYLNKDYCGDVPNCGSPQTNGYWISQPDLLVSVSAAASVALGNIFVFGGLTSKGESSATVQVYTSQDGNIGWQVLSESMPKPRHNASASCDVNGAIYVFGGEQVIAGVVWPEASVQRFDVRSLKWSLQNDMPVPRFSHASVSFLNQIWVLGGSYGADSPPTNAVNVYHSDTDTWSWNSSLRIGREGLCAGVIDGILYAVGGFDGSNYISSMEAFVNGTWVPRASMTYARSGASCAVVDGGLVVAGGRNAAGVLHLVEFYQPQTDTWLRRSDTLLPVWQGNGVALFDYPEQIMKVFVVGGTSSLPAPPGGMEWNLTALTPFNSSSPTLSTDESVLYVGSGSNLLAIDAQSGALQWSFPTPTPVTTKVALGNNGVAYFCTDTNLYQINTTTGQGVILSTSQYGYMTTPALSSDSSTLFLARYDEVLALDLLHGGTPKWSGGARSGVILRAPTLSRDGSMLFLGADAGVVALDTKYGSTQWFCEHDDCSQVALSNDDRMLYMQCKSGNLMALTATGDEKWQIGLDPYLQTVPVVSPDGSFVYVVSLRAVLALWASSGQTKWYFAPGSRITSSPSLSHDGSVVYVGTEGGICGLDAISGQELWIFSGKGLFLQPGTLKTDDSIIFVGTSASNLYALWTTGPATALNASSSFYPEL